MSENPRQAVVIQPYLGQPCPSRADCLFGTGFRAKLGILRLRLNEVGN